MQRTIFGRLVRAGVPAFVSAALLVPAAAQAAQQPTSITLSGTYTLVHVDGTSGHPGAGSYREELRAGGRSYNVSLRDGMAFRSGDTVRLSGRLDGSTLHVSRSQIQSFAPDTISVGG